MQPVKVVIPGNYWDVHLYMGKLYLWSMDGSVSVYNWSSFINSLISSGADSLAMSRAFLDGSYLYDLALRPFIADPDIQPVLRNKFQRLGDRTHEFPTSESSLLIGRQENPFKELPTDLQVYKKKVYAAADSGFWSASIDHGTKKPISSRPVRMWDCPLLSISANRFSQISLSAGEEGLYEYSGNDITRYGRQSDTAPDIHKVSGNHSLYANYSGLSVYNTSNLGESALELFEWDDRVPSSGHSTRTFVEEVLEERIFGHDRRGHLSWGVEDKIYSARDGNVAVVRFNNYVGRPQDQERFSQVKNIRLQEWKGEVISGGVAYFGIIIECENALVVARSDGQFLTIPGPITKWRVYPRSMNYENHLHVVLDNRVEIYSFNHDIAVDQSTKDLGISGRTEWYKTARSKKGRRGRA